MLRVIFLPAIVVALLAAACSSSSEMDGSPNDPGATASPAADVAPTAAPATFILDRDGVIAWKYVGQVTGDRASTDEIRARLAGLGA